jgi:PAS domain S-box-containing protein
VERKSQRNSLIVSSVLLLLLATLTFWQTSLDFGDFRPGGATETIVLWATSTLVVIGVLVLSFIVFRSLLRLYVDRQQNRLGSRIKTKLVAGALALSIIPVVCLVIFNFSFLNRTLDRWFRQPTEEILGHAEELWREVVPNKSEADARRIAIMPDVVAAFSEGTVGKTLRERLAAFADGETTHYVALVPAGARRPLAEAYRGHIFQGPMEWRKLDRPYDYGSAETVYSVVHDRYLYSVAEVRVGPNAVGRVVVAWEFQRQMLERLAVMRGEYAAYLATHSDYRHFRYFYLGMLSLIAIFVLFVGTWLALFLSKQIVAPIEALVEATGELSSGHLDFRIQARASDELGALVESFNRMTQQLESKTQQLQWSNEGLAQANVELESRRRLINAILESITPGVISVAPDGEILKVNSSLRKMFDLPADAVPQRLGELFAGEDLQDLSYMLNRARRTGLATRELVVERDAQIHHLAVTVSSIEKDEQTGRKPARFVVVLEDTTELLRAQKSAAWNEVARRVAHEIKNPLTPIALSAERMSRLLKRYAGLDDSPERRKLRERFEKCTDTIVHEVETVRALVDEFSQFARFPTANPERSDLNGVVEKALGVFQGRLDDVVIHRNLSGGLPEVLVDPEQFKRVVVNLIDNAAEAIQESWVKEIFITTALGPLPDTVELVVADSGPGISAEDKEKLFLPYFSTKKRGTGLGLAIVSRILSEHQVSIRVEDNRPSGSQFIIEMPTADSRASIELGVLG